MLIIHSFFLCFVSISDIHSLLHFYYLLSFIPSLSSSSSLNYPAGASEVLVADHLSKVKMNFDLVNKANKEKVTLHQVREGDEEEREVKFIFISF